MGRGVGGSYVCVGGGGVMCCIIVLLLLQVGKKGKGANYFNVGWGWSLTLGT